MLYTIVFFLSLSFPLVTTELPNGLDVVVGEDHASPIVTICIVVNTGGSCETAETNGLAHFYEHMFFKGNQALPDQTAYNNRMRELGIIRNGTTGNEMVKYFITVSADLLDEGLEFMYDAITGPLFDIDEMVNERAVIMNEYQRNTSSPYWNYRRMKENVLSVEPWRSSSIGDPAVIQSASPEVMHMFQHKYYTPDNAALIVTGDVDSEVVMAKISDLFGGWEYGGNSDYFSLQENIVIKNDTTVYVGGPKGMGMVEIVYVGPSMADQQSWTYAADAWGQYMSRLSGKFHEDLVTHGPFLDVHAAYYSQRFEPTITFGGTIDPADSERGLEMMREEIQDMFSDGYFDQSNLEVALDQLRRQRLFNEESSRDMATETLPFWWVEGGGLEYYNTYPDSLASVTVEDIRRFLDRWIRNQPSATFVLTPEGEWVE